MSYDAASGQLLVGNCPYVKKRKKDHGSYIMQLKCFRGQRTTLQLGQQDGLHVWSLQGRTWRVCNDLRQQVPGMLGCMERMGSLPVSGSNAHHSFLRIGDILSH